MVKDIAITTMRVIDSDGYKYIHKEDVIMSAKKKISVVIPCYNEEKTIKEIYDRLLCIFTTELKHYDYEIIYVDDYSKDNTREEIRKVCKLDCKVGGGF